MEQVFLNVDVDHHGARSTFRCAKAPFNDGVRGGGGNGGEGLRDLVLEAPCREIVAAKFLVGVQMRKANAIAGESFTEVVEDGDDGVVLLGDEGIMDVP